MAWDLAGNARGEIRRARFIEALGPERAAELLPLAGSEPTILSASEWQGPAGSTAVHASVPRADWRAVENAFAPAVALGLGAGEALGSNSWVLAGSRTASGKPILANDPHLGFRTPSVWYLATLDAPGLRATGATLPGIPAVLIGHNDRIAWGLTSLEPDVQDLFVEEVDPDDASRYRHRGEWKRFEERAETIRVKGGADVHPHGARDGARPGRQRRLRRRRSAGPGGLPSLERPRSGSRLDGSLPRDFHGPRLERISRRGRGPPGLVAQPDLRGRRWSYRLRGRGRHADPAPSRRPAPGLRDRRGRLDGFSSSFQPSARPGSRTRLPRHGQQPRDAGRSVSLRPDLGRAFPRRADRRADRGEGPADAGRRRGDPARPRLAAGPRAPEPARADAGGRRGFARRSRAARRLERRDGSGFRRGRDLRRLVRGARAHAGGRARRGSARIARGADSSSTRCGGIPPGATMAGRRESRPARRSRRRASRGRLELLRRRLGADPSGWRWERLHRAVFPHDVFHEVPVLRRFFDLEIGQGGDGDDRERGHIPPRTAPSRWTEARAIARSSTSPVPCAAATCITTGQSGNVFSRRYRDFLPDWRPGGTSRSRGSRPPRSSFWGPEAVRAQRPGQKGLCARRTASRTLVAAGEGSSPRAGAGSPRSTRRHASAERAIASRL